MTEIDRSPLHPNALRIQDLTPGREIICFSLRYGILERLRITDQPRVSSGSVPGAVMRGSVNLIIPVATVDNCKVHRYLTGIGILPYEEGNWNDLNFTIDAADEHLLPSPALAVGPNDTDDFGGPDGPFPMLAVD